MWFIINIEHDSVEVWSLTGSWRISAKKIQYEYKDPEYNFVSCNQENHYGYYLRLYKCVLELSRALLWAITIKPCQIEGLKQP